MIALGLALILIAGGTTVFTAIASTASSTATPLTAFNITISASPVDMFVAGALSVALLALGLTLISRGARRGARRHKELKQLRKDNASATIRATAGSSDHSSDGGAEGSPVDITPKTVNRDTTKRATNTAGPDTARKDAETPLELHPGAEQPAGV